MRIPVSLVINFAANGTMVEETCADYPDLEPEDIRQALPRRCWPRMSSIRFRKAPA